MEIELLMRRERKEGLSKEDREDFKTARLLPNFDEDDWYAEHKESSKYDYVPVTINVADASPYSQHDDDHTHIFLKGGLAFIAKIKYDYFQEIKMGLTGSTVLRWNDTEEEIEVQIKGRDLKPKQPKQSK